MEVLKFNIAAGQTIRFEKAGRYLEIIDAEQPLSLFFYDENGGQADDAQGVVSGLFIEGKYSAFQVRSGQAQTITLLLSEGRGGSRRQPGQVAVIDRVAAACQTMIVDNTAAAFAANVVIAPASNVAGVIIRASTCGTVAGAGNYSNGKLHAAPSAPASINPTGVGVLLNGAASNAAGVTSRNNIFDSRRMIPAGWGLYWLTEATAPGPTTNNVNVSFEIL